jgi:hypothetical protein
MKTRKTRWLALTFVALAFVLVGSLSGSDQAVAAPCCSSCDDGYAYCLASCGYTPECFDYCDAKWDRCFRYCSFSC